MPRLGPTRAQRERLAAWLEPVQNGSYVLTKPVQQGDDWSRFAHRYPAGQAGIDFHVGIRPSGSDEYAEYFGIRAQGAARGFVERDPVTSAGGRVSANQRHAVTVPIRPVCERCLVRGDHYDMQPPVLVYVGHSNQPRQGMELQLLSAVPSAIRLKKLHLVEIDRANVLKKAMAGDLLEFSDLRELDVLGLSDGRDPAQVNNGELIHEVVKGGAEVLNGVPEDEWPILADLYHAVNAVDHGPLFRVEIPPKGDQVRVWSPGFFDLPAQSVDMFFRSVKLRPRTRQVKASGHA